MLRFEWTLKRTKSIGESIVSGLKPQSSCSTIRICLTFVERVEDGEERWHAIGVVDERAVVTVVHTYRSKGADEIIRIISARRADADERKQYARTL